MKNLGYYEGVCVGGIADGKGYKHFKPEMTVQQRKKVDGEDVPTGVQTEYKFLLLLPHISGDLGVWVPVGTDVADVVARLLMFYRPVSPHDLFKKPTLIN